jgi:hypothetical protein
MSLGSLFRSDSGETAANGQREFRSGASADLTFAAMIVTGAVKAQVLIKRMSESAGAAKTPRRRLLNRGSGLSL